MANAHNYYLPHLRSGMAANLNLGDVSQQRLMKAVEVNFGTDAAGKSRQTTIDITLRGAGDVLGFNKTAILKTQPGNHIGNFNASFMPFIEFAEADFIWRFSSKKNQNEDGSTGEYWLPWLSLIVLKHKEGDEVGEFEFLKRDNPELPAQIQLSDDVALPDLAESWRWSHVHVTGEGGQNIEGIKAKIKQSPQQAISRLLCPRRLKSGVKYSAFIVPTYKLGLQAAMGQELTANRAELSWHTPAAGQGQIIPYYYHWEFRTGKRGDFETLIKELAFQKVEGIGLRTIDASNPGYFPKNDNNASIQVEGALTSPDTKFQRWGFDKNLDGNATQQQLAEVLNKRKTIGEDGEEILRVVPPVYGKWYIMASKKENYQIQKEKRWISEINLDFRHRYAASLGAEFIKENQEALMKSAWQQLREVKKTNSTLNIGKFGSAVSKRMFKRMATLPTEKLLQLSMPLHAKVRTSVELAPTPQARSINPAKSARKSLKGALLKSPFAGNLGQVKIKKYLVPKFTQSANPSTAPKNEVFQVRNRFELIAQNKIMPAAFQVGNGTILSRTGEITVADSSLAQIGNDIKTSIDPAVSIEKRLCKRMSFIRSWEQQQKEKKGLQPTEATQDKNPLRPLIWYPEFITPMYRYLRDKSQELLLPGVDKIPQNTVTVLKTNPRFIEAFMVGLNHEFAAELRWREYPTDMRGSYFRKFWDTTIYSASAVDKRAFKQSKDAKNLLLAVQKMAKEATYSDVESLEAIFNAPSSTLTEEKIQVAKMYETAIEFWLLSKEKNKDMKPIDSWRRNTQLGEHGNNTSPNQTVVLIRGEVLNKYPNVQIYLASKKVDGPDFQKKKYPIFEGNLPPDIVFLGFNIPQEQAENYFLIFQEPMSELQYGLDEINEGDELEENPAENNVTWQHFTLSEEEGYIDENAPMTKNVVADKWNNPAYHAKIFTQKSVRVSVPLSRFIN